MKLGACFLAPGRLRDTLHLGRSGQPLLGGVTVTTGGDAPRRVTGMYPQLPPRKTPDELADGVKERFGELQRSAQRARRSRDDQANRRSRVRRILRRILGRQDG